MTPAGERPDGLAPGLRVLLVEDEIMVALLLEDMLADLGHRAVGPVARLDKAVELARREALDAAILDLNVGGKEVYPVADALAARGIPFIFSSGYGRNGLRAPYADRPMLTKPFRRHDLRAALAALGRPKPG